MSQEKKLNSNDLMEIGEKGIGFKSIFGLAKKVKISSCYFCFSICRDNFFVPVAEYDNFSYSPNTVLELTLDEGMVEELYKYLDEKYNRIDAIVNENPILFLNKLTEIKYTKSSTEYFGFSVSRKLEEEEYSCSDTTIKYFSSDDRKNKSIKAKRFAHQIEYNVDECKSRYGDQEETTRKHKIIIIAPNDPGVIRQGRIYSFFATSEAINAPFIIHAPFRLNSGRTKIDSQSQSVVSRNKWFIRTLNETVSMIRFVYEQLAINIGGGIVKYIPQHNLVNPGCAIYSNQISKGRIVSWRIFRSMSGEFYPSSEVYMMDINREKKELCIIDNLLCIQGHLLDAEYGEIESFKTVGVHIEKNIENKLLREAIQNAAATEICCSFLEKYKPDLSVKELVGNKVEITMEQIRILSEFRFLSDWINSSTVEYLQEKEAGCKIECKNVRKQEKDISVVRSFGEEYGDSIADSFKSFLKKAKYYQVKIKNTIYLSNSVFGSNMLEDFARLYHELDPNERYFYPFLQMEAVSEEIDMLCDQGNEITDYEFVVNLGKHRKNQKNMLKEQYKNILRLIQEAGTSSERFLAELLQNIDDCTYTKSPTAIFRLEKGRDGKYKLYVSYNELGFQREQIRAITALGDSTKKKLLSANKTGEKGIGFKSVFAICESVQIESGTVRFRLSKEKPTVPEYIKEIEKIDGTTMVFTLQLPEKKRVQELLGNKEFIVSDCLCLKQLHSITINQKDLCIIENNNMRTVKFDKDKYDFMIYRYSFEIKNKIALKQRRSSKDVLSKQEIVFLIPSKNEIWNGKVYATFPTKEELEIPIMIDLPLQLDTSREHLLENEWNKEIINQLYLGILWFYEQVKRKYGSTLPKLFPEKNELIHLNSNFFCFKGLDQMLIEAKLYKIANEDRYISLEDGSFTEDIEYYILKKYKSELGENISNNILEKNEEYYEILQKKFAGKVKNRDFKEICKSIDYVLRSFSQKKQCILEDEVFRKHLYEFLANNKSDSFNLFKEWKIIPIQINKKTSYVEYSKDIYAPGDKAISSEKYKILDVKKMSEETFNDIYAKIEGSYKPISKFSKDVILGEFMKEIEELINISNPQLRAKAVLKLFNLENDLFMEVIKTRKDFPVQDIYFETKTGNVYNKDYVFRGCQGITGCLEQITVMDEYNKLADSIGVPLVADIDDYAKIAFEIGRKELDDLIKCDGLKYKKKLFSSIYTSDEISRELTDGIGFFELFVVVPRDVAYNKNQHQKKITVDEMVLKKYSSVINEISIEAIPILFDFKGSKRNFEKDNILEEIEDELQMRKETEKISKIKRLLYHCYYADLSNREPCCVREKENCLLFVDDRITADYDIIEVLKAYFLKYFNTELAINRNITRYTRRGYESISSIDASMDVVMVVADRIGDIEAMNIEDVKDLMCRPIRVKGKTYGGYAKVCPLCGSRVETELTGFRIYKTKCHDKILPILSCSNCHENLRYSSSINIDTDKIEKGILSMKCKINGYEWIVDDIVLRLGHRAYIEKLNCS